MMPAELRGCVGQNLPLDAMNRELADASAELVGNGDLLRGVLAGCGDCIKVLDLEGRLQFMSDGGKRVMEVDDFSALKGCPWPDFWAGEGNAQAKAAIAEAKAGRTAHFRNEANTARGNPRYWDVQVSPIFGGDGKPSHLLSISRDITEEWKAAEAQKEHAARQKFLTDELTHRVKNTFATVIAMANQTFRGEANGEARQAFDLRIRTLNAAYDVLNESSWTAGPVRRIVETALAPYRTQTGRFDLTGPDYALSSPRALALSLAVNELATNAMKYGALSTPDGKIAVSWNVNGGQAFAFSWHESGGPTIAAPTRSGFGSRLIKTVLADDFGGTVDVRYEPTGLVCELKVPA
jgi:PAS domain S-box-containing protein